MFLQNAAAQIAIQRSTKVNPDHQLRSGLRLIPHFVRPHALRILIISALLLIPCFWQRRIEAGDLRSHVYNAWIAHLIEQEKAPGLWIAQQWNNVLFDLLLSGVARAVGFQLAGRICAGLAVLIFFWGAFAFVAAVTGRAPWLLTPLLAAIVYGWTFQEGMFNYYLSIGLAFAGIALFQMAPGWKKLGVIAILPLVFVAHPLGLMWMIGAALYLWVSSVGSLRLQSVFVLGFVCVLFAVRSSLLHHYRTEAPAHSVLFFNGLDQLIFSNRYGFPVAMLCACLGVAFAVELALNTSASELLARCSTALGLYVMAEAAIQLLPDAIYLPQYAAPISNLTERLTMISAVLLCCVFGAIQPRKWHFFALAMVAAVYFTLLFQDTATLNRMEDQAVKLLEPLPSGQRILATITKPLKYRFNAGHIIEPSCVGRCFSYANYEAPSGQFRVRARPGNPIVMSDIHDATLAEQGNYVAKNRDLPLYEVYQCGKSWTELCIRPLKAGEINGGRGDRTEERR